MNLVKGEWFDLYCYGAFTLASLSNTEYLEICQKWAQKKQQIFFRLTASCAATRWRLFSCKIKEGGSTLGYRPLGYISAKAGGAVNGG